LDRLLLLLDGDEAGSRRSKLRSFGTLVALVICAEYWTKSLRSWGDVGTADAVALVAASGLTVAVLAVRRRRATFAGFALLQAWYAWSNFPHTGNHRYLELVLVLLFALHDEECEDERRAVLCAIRWMVVLILFWAGVHKLVHGYWFRGQFLAFSLWRDGFGAALGPFFSTEELARLSTYGIREGDGPYLVTNPLLLVVSNAVWLGELLLAGLLVPRLTRTVAWIATCAALVATEFVARELMFGIEFLGAVLLFARRDLVRPALIPAVLLLAGSLLVRLGLVGEVTFH